MSESNIRTESALSDRFFLLAVLAVSNSGRLSRFDQSDEEPASSGDSAVHSPRRKLRRRLTRKEKGKRKVSDSGTDRHESDQRESDFEGTGDGSSKVKSTLTEKALTSANERLC